MSAKADLEKFVRTLQRGGLATTSKANMRLIGERCIQLIVTRTQRGFGVDRPGGNEVSFKKLSSGYVDYRAKTRVKLDDTTRPEKSNLTYTGAMLRSMTVTSFDTGKVTVGPNNRRRKGGLTNAELAEILQKDRPFNNLSAKEIKSVVEFITDILQLEIERAG